jgi:spore germination protein D
LKKLLPFSLILILLTGCVEPSSSSSANYEEMKKVFTDALQTEDGKKALREILETPSFRELLVLEHTEVQTAIEQTLLSEKSSEFWKHTLEDPKMKEAFAKSIQKELATIQKDLLKDAGYQEELTKFFDQPEMQKQLESILKGTTMRKEIEKVVKDTIENPLMQTKWQELIKKSGESGGSSGSKEDEKKSEGQSQGQ